MVQTEFGANDRGFPVGARVTRVRRILFVHGATVDGATGPVEVSFDDGSVALFEVVGGGDTLGVEWHPWQPHFPEPVAPENEEFLRTSGNWEVLDLGAATWSYRQYVGRRLTSAERLDERTAVLDFEGRGIHVEVAGDELYVTFR
jgi:hypothetical protein